MGQGDGIESVRLGAKCCQATWGAPGEREDHSLTEMGQWEARGPGVIGLVLQEAVG